METETEIEAVTEAVLDLDPAEAALQQVKSSGIQGTV